MSASAPELLPLDPYQPLRVVLDTCVFPRRRWMTPILDAARAGHIALYWSPAILAEVNRLLTWLWLERHPTELTASA